MLHGTGGTETSLLPLAQSLDPEAAILSPRGKVMEHGMPRFFQRLAEGVFDEEDLIRRTHELAEFITQATREYSFDPGSLVAIGYSNGANIAGGLLLLCPGVLPGAALLRPMVPLIPETLPDLAGAPVLVSAGHLDPIVPAHNARRLITLLRDSSASVTPRFENAGHGLTSTTIETTRHWLADFNAPAPRVSR